MVTNFVPTISLTDTLIIAVFAGFIYLIGSFTDPDSKFDKYIAGLLNSLVFIFIPALLFSLFYYKITPADTSILYGILLSFQIVCALFFSNFAFSSPCYLKIIAFRNESNLNWLLVFLLMFILSLILMTVGLICSFYYSPYTKFTPVDYFSYVAKIFCVCLPVLISIATICLLLLLASKKPPVNLINQTQTTVQTQDSNSQTQTTVETQNRT